MIPVTLYKLIIKLTAKALETNILSLINLSLANGYLDLIALIASRKLTSIRVISFVISSCLIFLVSSLVLEVSGGSEILLPPLNVILVSALFSPCSGVITNLCRYRFFRYVHNCSREIPM